MQPLEHPYDPGLASSPWTQPPEPLPGADGVGVLVLAGYGLNCEAECKAGFEMVGARAEVRHVSDVLQPGASALDGVDIVVFGGGFSFGDHIASGRVFANRVRDRWGDTLRRFVDDGGLVLGICNGFQTLVKLGLLPALGRAAGAPLVPQQASLVHNDRPGYYDGWVKLRIDPLSPCVFTRGSTGAILEVPSRNGEGHLLVDPSVREEVAQRHLVPVFYVDAAGVPTDRWPDNPGGSVGGLAGLCDPTGRVFGLMPHPEAYLYPQSHPDWIEQRDRGTLPRRGQGLGLLRNGVEAVLAG